MPTGEALVRLLLVLGGMAMFVIASAIKLGGMGLLGALGICAVVLGAWV